MQYKVPPPPPLRWGRRRVKAKLELLWRAVLARALLQATALPVHTATVVVYSGRPAAVVAPHSAAG